MRAPKHSRTATGGAKRVETMLLEMGCGVTPVPQEQDLGTDMLAAIRDDRDFDTGLLLGVQVKSGPSFFKRPQQDAAGKLEGWWYAEDGPEHFDYWVKHHAPHLLVLYDKGAGQAYWVHVTAERCCATGKGVKILVPASQVLDPSQIDALRQVAATKRASISLEGTAFDAAAYPIAPGDLLRHALLTPRLVAPHQNRGFVAGISPEAAVAMLALYRVQQFQHLMKEHPAWPDLESLPTSDDWRWAFVHAVWTLLTKRDLALLEAACQASTRADWTACATCVLAAAHYDHRNVAAAHDVVRRAIAEDEAASVDYSWLLLHEARYALEMGDAAGARAAVERALSGIGSSINDASATFLRGLGYRNKLVLDDLQAAAADLGNTISAGDTAGAWWRAQQTLWAVDAAEQELFREWSGDDGWYLTNEPPSQLLDGVAFGAGLAADQSAWQAAQLRRGRFLLMRSSASLHPTTGASDTASALHTLVRSGNVEAFALAAGRLVRHGPCWVLATLAPMMVPDKVLRSQSAICLRFWKDFGRFADAASAAAFATSALAVVQMESGEPDQRAWVDGHHRVQLLDALGGAVCVVSSSVAAAIASAIRLLTNLNEVEADTVGYLLALLTQWHPSAVAPDQVVELAQLYPDAMGITQVVSVLAKGGDPAASEWLRTRRTSVAIGGREIALHFDFLKDEDLEKLSTKLRETVAGYRTPEQRRASGGNRRLTTRLLTSVALKSNDIADWHALADYLGDAILCANDKVDAVFTLARKRDSIDTYARGLLVEALDGLGASRYAPRQGMSGERDAAVDLAAVLGDALAVPGANRDDQRLVLLHHPAAAIRQRGLRSLSFRRDQFAIDAAVHGLNDPDVHVRATAAGLVGKCVRAGEACEALSVAVTVIAHDRGECVPLTFLESAGTDGHAVLGSEAEVLRNHASAWIRYYASAAAPQPNAPELTRPPKVAMNGRMSD